MTFTKRLIPVIVALCIPTWHAQSADLGQHGPVWPIAEQNLLDVIYDHLRAREAAGDVERLQQEMTDNTRAYVNRPRPVPGLTRATEPRSFLFDPSITVQQDLADHEGRVFAYRGQRVNPLEYSAFNKRIIVLDGDDADQVAYALTDGDEFDTLLVITNGSPLDLAKAHNRRFWFDQDGVIVNRFHIEALPTVITREDPYLRIEEVVLDD